MYKIVVVDKNAEFGMNFAVQEKIFADAGMEFVLEDCQTEEETIEKCKDADAIFAVYQKITPHIIESLENCKIILRYGIGYDNIDVPAATKKGIMVCNAPTYCLQEVATHAMALILCITRKISYYNEETKKGIWAAKKGLQLHRLSSLTLGLIGFGNIAKKTAEFAKPFGFTLLAYDPFVPAEVFESCGVQQVSLDELYAASDIISVHVPLFESTKHIINKDSIAKMKDGVKIVNTSRGGLVCEEDLIAALKSGKVQAAGLDVLESEPITEPNHPIFAAENVIISPHAAYSSAEADVEMLEVLSWTAVNILNGERPANIVNKKDLGL